MTGLILVMVAAALVAHAIPSLIKRRYVTVTSREGDRFSSALTLVDSNVCKAASGEQRSSRPLLAQTVSDTVTGKNMCETQLVSGKQSAKQIQIPSSQNVKEYAALKARRASRVSVESAAAKRRLVTVLVGTVMTVLFVVLGAVGVLALAWFLLPLTFLGGSLVASILAGRRSERIAEVEDARILELCSSFERRQVKVGSRSDGADAHEVPRVDAQLVDTQLKGDCLSQAGDNNLEANPTTSDLSGKMPASSGGKQWEYVPLPASVHAARPNVRNRAVHIHTDISGVRQVDPKVAVPGRPTRKSHSPMSVEEIETSTTPTFKFDLEAVLEQRRAQ